MSSGAANIKPSYQRFVTNQIRKSFGFEGVPAGGSVTVGCHDSRSIIARAAGIIPVKPDSEASATAR